MVEGPDDAPDEAVDEAADEARDVVAVEARLVPVESAASRPGRRALLGAAAGLGVGLVGIGWGVLLRDDVREIPTARRNDGPFGPLGPPDELGLRIPSGFTASLVARTGDEVGTTGHIWHGDPDGAACFRNGSGHVLVSNSESGNGAGGVSAVEFAQDGSMLAARTILSGTSRNCAGGATPWGTWLSCEERDGGLVWECDPLGRPAAVRPALGAFRHEAVAVDHLNRRLYLTEDRPDGRLYRFTPNRPADLSAGLLEAASLDGDRVRWIAVSADEPARSDETTGFDGGEGIVLDGRSMLFTTKGDQRVWELDLETDRIGVLYDALATPAGALTHVDNITVHPQSRHIFVAEDGGNMELCVLVRSADGLVVAPMLRFDGHGSSEVTGPAFSPDGRHLYVSSQRGSDGRGVTVRVTGPWVPSLGRIEQGAVAEVPARRSLSAQI